MKTTNENLLIEKYMLDEGQKMKMVVDVLNRNLDLIIKSINKTSKAARFSRIDNMKDKRKALEELKMDAKQAKEEFVRIIFRIEELNAEIEQAEEGMN